MTAAAYPQLVVRPVVSKDEKGGRVISIEFTPIDEICAAFEELESVCDYTRFFESYSVFPESLFAGISPTLDDYKSVRDVLYLAMRLRKLADTGGATLQELKDVCGDLIRIEESNEDGFYWNMRIPIKGVAYARELAHLTEDYGENMLCVKLRDAVPTLEYICDEFAKNHYSKELVSVCAAELAHLLFTAHMRGIRVEERGGLPAQVTESGLSALWLAYLNKMANCTIFTCKACRRPMIVREGRGKRREYCSDACKVWAHKHPGQTRAMRLRQ